jgi:hypothetical protein
MEIDMVHRDAKSFKHYPSRDRDVRIFNEEHSRIAPVYFKEAFENSHRFSENDDEPVAEHNEITHDMFLTIHGEKCGVWGDMQSNYLQNETIDFVVTTMVANLVTKEQTARITAVFEKPILGAGEAAAFAMLNPITRAFPGGTAKWKAFAANMKDDKSFYTNKQAVDAKQVTAHASLFNDKSVIELLCLHAFMTAKINLGTFKAMHANDVFIPVDIILARPWMTYNMSSVIVMKAGKETGETIIGQQDFQMSSNTQDRTLEASYMYYGKAIVKKSRNVVIAPRVFCQSYVKGNNVEFVKPQTIKNEVHARSGVFESHESILSIMVPCHSNVMKHNWIDIRGANSNVSGVADFHLSKEFYTHLLNIDDLEISTPTEEFIDYEDMSFAANTLCWLGHVEYGGDKGNFVSLNMGHLGPNTYDQVNNSRKEGNFAPIQRLSYNTKSLG